MITQLLFLLSGVLILIGVWALLTRRNLMKIVIGFSIVDTGIHMFLVAIGYVKNGTAPIFDKDLDLVASAAVVDPIPSALVLTAIVIGLAVTALMLSYVIKVSLKNRSLLVEKAKELKW